ncbi:MAG: S8 family serine peptidase [Bacteroidota bacterium]
MTTARLLLLWAVCFIVGGLNAQQNDYQLQLKSGTYNFTENVKSYPQQATIAAREVVNDRYYRILQFFELPDQAMHQNLKQQDIHLLEYLSKGTYVASLPTNYDLRRLEGLKVRSIQVIENEMKIVNSLQQGLVRGMEQEREVSLVFYKDIEPATARAYCEFDGMELLAYNDYNNIMLVRLPDRALTEIAELPYVSYIDEKPDPAVPDDLDGRGLHRASAIDVEYKNGRHYNGEGVNILCRDDGAIGEHIDFQGRLDQSSSGGSRGNHGDGVSGIMTGAGNVDPRYEGMASGAFLYVIDYRSDFLDETMDLFFDDDVIVTNSSYSDGCNRGYTTRTRTVDQQLYDNPTLMHVFSAGNSNGNDCGYGAGMQWGNITGGHKQAKNCIATANLFDDADLANSSSRGPAHDGRIKPDISAHGQNQVSTDSAHTYFFFGGTSGAAPGIAGVMAQLHQAYSELNGGERGSAALLKAIMLNTANDLGRRGPDFQYGWGHVNALRAATTLEDNRYLQGAVLPGQTSTHTIDIPAGVREVRVMTYWMDPPASNNTNKALVNNLDTRLRDAGGDTYLPWLLNPTPDPFLLDAPATRGVDNLNNVEQVVIDNPAAGTYTLEVEGSELPFGEHEYYVVWEFYTDDITLIYPKGGEKMVPGEQFKMFWDAASGTQPFFVSYSVDAGASWIEVARTNAEDRIFTWAVPTSVITNQALFRVTRGGVEAVSDTLIHIAPLVQNVRVERVCLDYIQLEWNPSANAVGYDIYKLGERYMELIDSVTTNTAEVPISNPAEDAWLAVSAKYADGTVGRRTRAIRSPQFLQDCLSPRNMTLSKVNNLGKGSVLYSCDDYAGPIQVEIVNNSTVQEDDIRVGYRINGGSAIVENIPQALASSDTFTYVFNQQPLLTQNRIVTAEVWVNIDGDMYSPDDTITRVALLYTNTSGVAPTIFENFEGPLFPRNFWGIENEDNSVTWARTSNSDIKGRGGQTTRALALRCRDYDNIGAEDVFSTIPIDLSQIEEGVFMSFEYAHVRNSSNNDGLRVEVWGDCEGSFKEVVFERFGTALVTASISGGGNFIPELGTEWEYEVVNLTPFKGSSSVIVRFIGINGGGNNIFIDNINIEEVNDDVPQAEFRSDDDVCIGESLVFINESEGELLDLQWNFGIGALPSTAIGPGPHFVQFQLPRPTAVTLTATNPFGADTLTRLITVSRDPNGDFSFDDNEGTVDFSSTGGAVNNHLWRFGDGNISTEVNPRHTYASPGEYTVVLEISNACGVHIVTKTVDISVVSIFDPNNQQSVQVLPNPNDGQFELLLQTLQVEELDVRLFDTKGSVLYNQRLSTNAGETRLRFDQQRLPAGLYILQLRSAEQTRSMKVVVE